MYIECVKHIRFDNEKEYKQELKKIIEELNGDCNIIESRYNSDTNGYKAEIQYGFYVSDYDY